MTEELITCKHDILPPYYGFKSTWISEEYCPVWKLWLGLREILQNQYDSIIEEIYKKNKTTLSMKEIKENIFVEQIPNETDFIFYKNYNKDEIVREIKFSEDDGGKLTAWNNGKLERGNLLLGGIKDPNNPGLIGRFGEG